MLQLVSPVLDGHEAEVQQWVEFRSSTHNNRNLFLSRDGWLAKCSGAIAGTVTAVGAVIPHVLVGAIIAEIGILALQFLYGRYQMMYDFILFECRMLLIIVCRNIVPWLQGIWEYILLIWHAFSTASFSKRWVWNRREFCRKNSFLMWWQATKKKILGGFTNSCSRRILCLALKRKSKIWSWSTQLH